ncbi:MAG: DNA/RNA non-specific endonuclease [Chloracidobacterium sp.]|nr:DNA/RNA non-specific endonuclease [Chloracidobacterium sp.]
MLKCLFLALVFGPFFPVSVFSQFCSDCEIPSNVRAARPKTADKALSEATLQQNALVKIHLPFGIPKAIPGATNESIFVQFGWITWYDAHLKSPLWVAYEFSKADALKKKVERLDCFRRDSRLFDADAPFCHDHRLSSYVRGHLIPANDSKRWQEMMDNSFRFSNMAPLLKEFNRRVWMRLEGRVNKWAVSGDGVKVVTGAVFDKDTDGQRDRADEIARIKPRNRVGLASHFYKILIHRRPTGVIDSIAFLLPHNSGVYAGKKVIPYLNSRIVSIDDIEAITGIDFYPDMPFVQQNAIEGGKATSIFKWLTL